MRTFVVLSCLSNHSLFTSNEKTLVPFKRFTLVKEALIEIGCVVTSLVVGWLSHACTVAKRCILGL